MSMQKSMIFSRIEPPPNWAYNARAYAIFFVEIFWKMLISAFVVILQPQVNEIVIALFFPFLEYCIFFESPK